MGTVLDAVRDAVAERGLAVTKAIPRSAEHMLLELRDAAGSAIAGQWFAEETEACAVFARTHEAMPELDIGLLGSSGIVLQPDGADRKLRTLHRLAAAPGASLVAHRPEQRGVVRCATGATWSRYIKLVRAKRLARTVAGARLSVPGVELPRVLSVDRTTGSVTFAELPGRTLYELLADPHVRSTRVEAAGRAVGKALARLHHTEPPADLPHHDAGAELAVTGRWVDLAIRHGLLGHLPVAADRLLATAREELSGRPCLPGLLHRDLHDRQVVLDGARVGMLDFDLAAVGEPALDLANLLVHLELRTLQGRCAAGKAAACTAAVLDGYRPAPAGSLRRAAAYRLATRLRLASVYAFRPAHVSAGAALLEPRPTGPSHVLEEALL